MALKPSDVSGLTPQQMADRFSVEELQQLLTQLTPAQHGTREGVTPYDPNADFFSSQSLKGMASNIIPSAGNMVSDIGRLVTSPIESGKAIYEAGPSGIYDALKERFGGWENIKRTAFEDPFGLALDATPGLQALGGLAKGSGMVGRLGALARGANPITMAAKTAAKGGKMASGMAREMAGITTGIDPGVITTARRSLTGSQGEREAFESGLKRTASPTAIPEGVKTVIETLKDERGKLIESQAADLGKFNVTAKPERLRQFKVDVLADLQKSFKQLKLDKDQNLDLSGIGGLRAAPKEVKRTLNDAWIAVRDAPGGLFDLWDVRQDVDRIAEVAEGARVSQKEVVIFATLQKKLTGFMEELGGKKFAEMNRKYAETSDLIKNFSEISSVKGKVQTQINSVVKAIREQSRFSEDILERVEARTGVPLRALSAGTEFSEGVARGLIGRSKFAEVAFVGASAIMESPLLLTGLLFTSPKFVGRVMEFLGATERQFMQARRVIDNLMGFEQFKTLAEQGMTTGAILQQLARENQPNLMDRIGTAAR